MRRRVYLNPKQQVVSEAHTDLQESIDSRGWLLMASVGLLEPGNSFSYLISLSPIDNGPINQMNTTMISRLGCQCLAEMLQKLSTSSGSSYLSNRQHIDTLQDYIGSSWEVDQPSQREEVAEKRHLAPARSSAVAEVGLWIMQCLQGKICSQLWREHGGGTFQREGWWAHLKNISGNWAEISMA